MTIATVGFGDFAPKTDVGKIVTIVYLCGWGCSLATATAIADAIILRPPTGAPSADWGTRGRDEPPKALVALACRRVMG